MKPFRHQAICLPFDSEAEYVRMIQRDHLSELREYLLGWFYQHPELFPDGFGEGFTFHSRRRSRKLDIELRRVRINRTGRVYGVRPSFVLPFCVGFTGDVEKAMFLRQFEVPFDALAYVFGRSAKFYERVWLTLGRPSLVGSTVKSPEALPRDLLIDEKHTQQGKQKVFVATTVGGGCILGAEVVPAAVTDALTKGYGQFASEAREVDPQYTPRSVCTDGWDATRKAFQALFPSVVLVLCFLHSAVKVSTACLKRFGGDLRQDVLNRVWEVYRAENKRSFSQRIRRLRQWSLAHLSTSKDKGLLRLGDVIEKLCNKRPAFLKAYDVPGAHRTSNMLDRLMDYQDRLLYGQRYFHSPDLDTSCLVARAQAMLWNFHPYGQRLRREQPHRISPFHDLNGFVYHDNWLHNLFIAASMGGSKM